MPLLVLRRFLEPRQVAKQMGRVARDLVDWVCDHCPVSTARRVFGYACADLAGSPPASRSPGLRHSSRSSMQTIPFHGTIPPQQDSILSLLANLHNAATPFHHRESNPSSRPAYRLA